MLVLFTSAFAGETKV